MTWRKIVLGGAFCLLYLSVNGSAQEHFNSSTLREYCKLAEADSGKLSDDDFDGAMICTYYVNGVLDGYEIGVGPEKSLICLPDKVSRGQLTLVVAKYLEDRPEMLQNDPEYLVIDAISKAFPCGSKTAPK